MDGKEFRSDQLMKALITATAKAGHRLTFEEAQKTEGLPAPNTFAYHWGSYDQAAQIAWKKVQFGERGGESEKVVAKMSKAAQMMLSKSNH